MAKQFFALFPVTISLLFFSCSNNNTFTMGEELVDIKTNIISSDTSTIWSYTVKRDSVITSGFNKALIGVYQDRELGTITASTYLEIGIPGSSTITDVSAVYDSITLGLKFSHYYYGDTTKPYTIKAYKLTESMEDRLTVNGGYLYNTTALKYDESNLVGSATVIPKPSKNDSIVLSLSNNFGQDLFNKFKYQTTEVLNTNNFLKYLKGFILKPGNASSAILGFGARDTSLHMRLYYTYSGSNGSTIHTFLNFSVNTMYVNSTQTYVQFNNINVSRNSSDPLNSLHKLEDVVPSTATNNQTYCQEGTGLITKLEFPYLKQMLQTGTNVKILKAELILCPIRASYYSVTLPKNLYLNYTDNLNTFGSYLTSQGNTLVPTLTIDEHYNEKTQYSFDLTSYIASAITQTSSTIPALEVSIPYEQNNMTLSRVILGDALHKVNTAKLRILYWRY